MSSLRAAAQEIADAGALAPFVKACDVQKPAQVRALAAAVEKRFGRIDILVHNAGGPPKGTALGLGLDAWREGFERNFLSLVSLCDAAVPGMRRRRWGRVLAIASTSVKEPIANLAVSNAMRPAVAGYLKTLADEVGPDGVLVNTLMPGLTGTDRLWDLAKAMAKKNKIPFKKQVAAWKNATPVRRIGDPAEIAVAAAFLVSEPASFITGVVLAADGGRLRGNQ